MVDFRMRLNLGPFGFFYISLENCKLKISFSAGGITRIEENCDEEESEEESLSFEENLEQSSLALFESRLISSKEHEA